MGNTWQSTVVEINPGAYSEMSVLNGKANIFMATNATNEDIYIGLGEIPRMDSYEKVLKRNTTDVFGRPTPVNRVYFLNLSSSVLSIRVWHTYDENFDYTLLKSMTVDLQGAALDGLKYDGIIQGVKTGVSLPISNSGINTINTNVSAIKTLLQNNATTNQTILEGINAILATL